MNWAVAVLCVHLVATLLMTGLIWFVQIVHYPLLRQVGASGFVEYERSHMHRTTWVVAPLMIVEAISAVMLCVVPEIQQWRWLVAVGLGLLMTIWCSTACLQAPYHNKLAKAYDRQIINRLVRTNWIRTVGWTLRACIAVILMIRS